MNQQMQLAGLDRWIPHPNHPQPLAEVRRKTHVAPLTACPLIAQGRFRPNQSEQLAPRSGHYQSLPAILMALVEVS